MIKLIAYKYWRTLAESKEPASTRRCSVMQASFRDGRVHFSGAKYGSHSVVASDAKSVHAHWLGYVQASAPKAVPARITARILAKAFAEAETSNRFE